MKKYDLIIIGGGIMGTFHAYHALKRGLKVALVEQHKAPQGATVRNFGQIVPSGMSAKWQLLGRRSIEIYQMLQAELDISVRQYGSVYLASNEEEMSLLEELAAINKENDYESHLLTKEACLEQYEGLKKTYCQGGLFFPTEISLNPRFAVNRILAYLEEKLALEYLPSTTACAVETKQSDCSIRTTAGQVLRAEKVLVCSGSEFKLLFPELFRASPLEVSKLQMLQLEPQPTQKIKGNILTGLTIRRYEAFSECPSYATIKAREPQNSFQKKYGIHILFKQAEDGSVILGDSHEYADAASADELGFDSCTAINQFILQEAQKIFDLQSWKVQHTWYGRYSQSKTAAIFQRVLEDKIHIVTGIGGKGMTASAGFAEQHIAEVFGLN